MQKKCFKCHILKPIDYFYVHKQMGDGHLNKCKECTRKDVGERYNDPARRQYIREYEHRRFQTPHRKKLVLEYAKKRIKRDPIKNRARAMVGRAVRSGSLVRMPCQECGDKKAQAHHDDYSKPLEVRWFCFYHHRTIGHGQIVG